ARSPEGIRRAHAGSEILALARPPRGTNSLLRTAALALATLTVSLYLAFGPLPALALGPEPTLLVTFKAGTPSLAAEELIAASGARLIEHLKPLAVYRAAVPSGSDVQAVLEQLQADHEIVRAAEIEGEQVADVVPNDSLYRAFQWNLRRIGMEQAWDLRPSAADVIVGVLDTGVDLSHPDLRPNLLLDLGYDFLNDAPRPQDDESHGTAVAGIIGAV